MQFYSLDDLTTLPLYGHFRSSALFSIDVIPKGSNPRSKLESSLSYYSSTFFINYCGFMHIRGAVPRKRTFLAHMSASLKYSQFDKTLSISSLQMHWISVRFYEMGDSFPSQPDIFFFFKNNPFQAFLV